MKIGIFTDCYYPQVNGVVTSVLMLEEELIKLGHQVTIITVKVPNNIDNKDNILYVRSVPFVKLMDFRLALPFHLDTIRTIKNMDFDLIHTHTEFSVGLLGKYMARLYKIPCIHTYHTMYEDYTHYIYNLKYGKNVVKKFIKQSSKIYVKKYDGIIAPTDKTCHALRSYGVKNDIFVVPTGIDLNHFTRFSKEHPYVKGIMKNMDLKASDKIILSLGRVSEEKNIQTIISQMPELIREEPRSKLLIVGDGPYRKKLEKMVNKLGLVNHVRFTGQVPFEHVSYYYSVADVFVSASKTETQGLTIMEAMASDVPVIVYDDLNVKDIVTHNYSGRLFQTSDQLTRQLVECFKNPSLTRDMARKAQQVVSSLSKETYAKNAEEVYYQLIKQDINHSHRLNA